MRKRVLSIVTAFVLFLNTLSSGVQATGLSDTNVNGHNPENTPVAACTHEHDENCYKLVTQCIHEHTDECYPDEKDSVSKGDAVRSDRHPDSVSEGDAVKSDGEPSLCVHECSVDNGCIVKILDCTHEHSEECGYAGEENSGTAPAEEEFFDAPYYLWIVHSLEVEGEQFGASEMVELKKEDFVDGVYDLSRNIMQKEGMKSLRAGHLDSETYDLVEGWTVSLSDFAEGGDPEDGSNYYAVQVLIEYGAATGYRAVVSENPTPVDDPYGIMLLTNFTGSNINDVTFEAAYIVNITVNYMYSPTGGLSGTPAADSEQHQVMVTSGGVVADTWEIPYYNAEAGAASLYQNLNGFRIVLDSKPLNYFLVDSELADAMSENPDPETVKSAIENDLFIIDTKHNVYDANNANGYSDEYNAAWDDARSIETAYYKAVASSSDGSVNGAGALSSPRLTVTILDGKKDEIIKRLKEIMNAESEAERAALQNKLDNDLTVTVYYRRNIGFYTINHWVPNLSNADITKYVAPEDRAGQVRNGKTYYKVYIESKQGRIGALTNAISGMDLMERAGKDSWLGLGRFDFTPYVTEGFAQKIVEPGGGTALDIYYDTASEYRIIFDTNETYIPRVSVELNDTLKFTTESDGTGKLTVSNASGSTEQSDYQNPKRAGYEFAGWKYEVQESTGVTPDEDGHRYVVIPKDAQGAQTLTINENLKAQLVLANDADSTVKAIHLYPVWTPARASVRVVFWTENLSGGPDDVKVAITNPKGDYENRVAAYLNGTPETVKESAGFSNLGSFTFMATAEEKLNLFIENGVLKTSTSGTYSSENVSGDLAVLVDGMFDVRMPEVETAKDPVQTSQFYYPYLVNGQKNLDITVEADGSTIINVYYARNVYSADFTYYGNVGGNLSIATNTVGYSKGDNPGNYSYQYEGATDSTQNVTNAWQTVISNPVWSVPEKVTITAKYGADIRDVWPRSNFETIGITTSKNSDTATFISWGTTAGQYNAKFKADRLNGSSGESTLMGVFSAMGADIIADPETPGTVHHMYAYWSDHGQSYYRFNHCYEVPDLTWEILGTDTAVVAYDITGRAYGNSTPNTAMTNVSAAERANRNTMYLVPVGGILKDYFDDYSNVLLKVNNNGIADESGQYYAVRRYTYTTQDGQADRFYALARQVNAASTNSVENQNPSARLNMTRVNVKADHDTRVRDTDGIYNEIRVGSSEAPYDLYFYYDRNRFTITYMVPARDSASGEYTLGTRESVFGSSLSRYKVDFDKIEGQLGPEESLKKLYSNDTVFNNVWTAYNLNSQDTEGDALKDGYVRIVPNSAVNGQGTWRFTGWALDRAASQLLDTDDDWSGSISGNLRLFAIWEAPEYNVTFEMDGGVLPNGSGDNVNVTVPANQGYTSSGEEIPRPIKNGFTLSGWDWYTADSVTGEAKELQSDFTFETPITQNMVARAKWVTFVPEYYSYKVWYLTKDTNAARRTGEGWLSEAESGTPVPETAYSQYTNVLGCKFFNNEPYPKGTNLLLGAESFAGYIPVNGNAAIALEDTNRGETAQNTRYVAYFYYDKAETRSYKIQFQSADNNVILGITQEGSTDQAYFVPNDETFRTLRAAGYQLVAVDGNGEIIVENGRPKTAASVEDLKDFIAAVNAEFLKDETDRTLVSTNADGTVVVTFKVMPIDYAITYNVGALVNGESGQSYVNLRNAMKSALEALENQNGRVDRSLGKIQNPTIYNVSDFYQFDFTLDNPAYVQNPDNVSEWWKFTGWSRGEGTEEATRAVTGEYGEVNVTHAVGNLEFLANWERVNAGVTVKNEVKSVSEGIHVPNDSFDYTITLNSGSPADILAYKTDAAGKMTQVALGANGAFQLKNGETMTFADFTGGYTVKQTNTGEMFDSAKEKYYTLDNVTGSVGSTNNITNGTSSNTHGTDEENIIFTNLYTVTVQLDGDPAEPGIQGFPVTKYLLENNQRRAFFGGNSYTFLIRKGARSDIATPPVPASVVLHSTAGDMSLKDHFATIRFTKNGTYTYVISEERPDGTSAVPGVSYDPIMYRITVDVSANAAGDALVAAISKVEWRTTEDTSAGGEDGWTESTSGAIEFNNVYNTTEVSRTFMPTKVLTGRDNSPLRAGEFDFTLSPAGYIAMTQTQAEEYHDRRADDLAKLAYLQELDAAGEFRNNIAGVQQPMPPNAVNGKVTNGLSGAILLSPINYTSAHMYGNAYGMLYKYTISEDVPAEAVDGKYQGITYDSTTKTLYVYVHLHDVGGNLAALGDGNTLVYADVLGDRNAAFVNTYAADSITVDLGERGDGTSGDAVVTLEKQINGREFQNGDEFTFDLIARTNNAPMPAQSKVTIRPVSGTSASVFFGSITFTQAGTYEYELQEENGTDAKMTYDTTPRQITVTVTDDGEGNLTADLSIDNVTWVNGYVPDPVDVDLGGDGDTDGDGVADTTAVKLVKNITGREFKTGDSFTFRLTAVTAGAPMPKDEAGSEISEAVISPVEGTGAEILFGRMTFTQPGFYGYTLTEVPGSIGGMTYDTGAKNFIVIVRNAGGQLTAAIADGNLESIPDSTLTWENIYTPAPAKVDLGGDGDTDGDGEADSTALSLVKNMAGRNFLDGDSFTFSLEANTPDAPMPANASVTVTPAAGTNGATIDFGEIEFTKAGEYRYTLKEKADVNPSNGITYDTEAKHITVTVTDDGEGHLRAVCNTGSVVWINRYNTEVVHVDLGSDGQDGSVRVALEKQLDGRAFRSGDSFTFTVAADRADAPMPVAVDGSAVSRITITPAAGTTAEIPFGRLTFTKAGDYTYTLREQAGTARGMNYDTAAKSFTVRVTDDGKGKLNAEVLNGITLLTWVNTYAPVPVDVNLGGDGEDDGDGEGNTMTVTLVKNIRGREFREGDKFTFVLMPIMNAPVPKDENGADVISVAITPTSGTSTNVELGQITYTKEGVYIYAVREREGFAEGMIYDKVPQLLTITVTDNDGVLTATANSLTWTNTYDPTQNPDSGKDNKPGDDGSDSDDDSGDNSGNDSGAADNRNKLPQTGLLWWPVWLTAIVGAVMTGVGIVRNRNSRRGKHEK